MSSVDDLSRLAATLPSPWLIVTDLDGTLLDHFDYSHAAVDPVLQRLEHAAIPVVFNTSKTFAELQPLREELGNRHPFIVENGSAIYIPRHYFRQPPPDASSAGEYDCLQLGRSAADIRGWLAQTREAMQMEFTGFADMPLEDIMAATGLPRDKAEQASQRLFSEAIRWQDGEPERQAFIKQAAEAGWRVLQGGRFIHLLGRCDKGMATERLAALYAAEQGARPGIIAAGDGNNDVDMLQVADLAIAVRSPVHDFPAIAGQESLIHTRDCGPAGWARVIGSLLDQGA